MKILNDTHIGAKRMAGTTPASQIALKDYLVQNLLDEIATTAEDVMILGDLFDSYSVGLSDMVAVFHILAHRSQTLPKFTTYVVAGNHDLSKTSTTMSSFVALQRLLQNHKNIKFITEPTLTPHGYVIPHLPNQVLFDEALTKVPATNHLFLHCNYDNGFAEQSDHSLNLSAQAAKTLPVKNIVIGHEHAHRQIGNVWIPGVQWATSVSDCLHSTRFYHTTVGMRGVAFHERPLPTYHEVPVFSDDVPSGQFIRIVGERPKADLEPVLKWVNKVRQDSTAFVVANAVKFTSEEGTFSLEGVGESVKSFDVREAIKETLTLAELHIFENL